jgi:hypothetical protein
MGLMLQAQCGWVYRPFGAGGGDEGLRNALCGPGTLYGVRAGGDGRTDGYAPSLPDCDGEVILYDYGGVRQTGESSGRYPLIEWHFPDGRKFSLSGADRYVCPGCTEATLTFEVVGHFD